MILILPKRELYLVREENMRTMKTLSLLASLASFLSAPTFAQSMSNLQITDFAAYAQSGIDVSKSDYLGLVASSGDIRLKNFLINPALSYSDTAISDFAVYAMGSVSLDQSTICSSQDFNCQDRRYSGINSSQLSAYRSNYLGHNSQTNGRLFSQLQNQYANLALALNQKTAQATATLNDGTSHTFTCSKSVNVFKLILNGTANNGRELVLNCNSNQNAVIILASTSGKVDLRKLGIKGVNSLSPSRILYYVPSSSDVILSETGNDGNIQGRPVGIPGTFFAPKSTVYFSNALITGALWAKSIRNLEYCENGGQINGMYSEVVNNILRRPSPHPQPTPSPNPTPCPQPNPPRPTPTPIPAPTSCPTPIPSCGGQRQYPCPMPDPQQQQPQHQYPQHQGQQQGQD